jgi:hypothetical protein
MHSSEVELANAQQFIDSDHANKKLADALLN